MSSLPWSRLSAKLFFEAQLDALGDKTLVAHIGAGSTRQSIEIMEAGLRAGITTFAALTPYYLPASPAATLAHFSQISAAADGAARVYVYLFPARTNTLVSPDELAAIAALPGIVGTKISGLDLDQVLAYRAATPGDFEVYTGSDADFPRVGKHGLDGVVSGVASCFPKTFDRMIDALDSADPARISSAHADVAEAVDLIIGDIGRIKVALAAQGIGVPELRMAIEPADAGTTSRIQQAVARLEA